MLLFWAAACGEAHMVLADGHAELASCGASRSVLLLLFLLLAAIASPALPSHERFAPCAFALLQMTRDGWRMPSSFR